MFVQIKTKLHVYSVSNGTAKYTMMFDDQITFTVFSFQCFC